MAACRRYVASIFETENIGDSLIKINNNFLNLKNVLCDLHERVDSTVAVRTFFYYGSNATSTNPQFEMENNVSSRPANSRIENFINIDLNLDKISKVNDQAYVIYQKTGYLLKNAVRVTTGTVTVPPPPNTTVLDKNNNPVVTTWGGPLSVNWSTDTPEKSTYYSPTFIIWKLVFNGTRYSTSAGFPVFSSAHTASTNNWNNPQNWSTY